MCIKDTTFPPFQSKSAIKSKNKKNRERLIAKSFWCFSLSLWISTFTGSINAGILLFWFRLRIDSGIFHRLRVWGFRKFCWSFCWSFRWGLWLHFHFFFFSSLCRSQWRIEVDRSGSDSRTAKLIDVWLPLDVNARSSTKAGPIDDHSDFVEFAASKLGERPTIFDSHSDVSKDFIDQKRDEKDVQKVCCSLLRQQIRGKV